MFDIAGSSRQRSHPDQLCERRPDRELRHFVFRDVDSLIAWLSGLLPLPSGN
jgi:hypothetical protein